LQSSASIPPEDGKIAPSPIGATLRNLELELQKRYGIDQSVAANTDIAVLFLMSYTLVEVNGKPLQDPHLAKLCVCEMRPWKHAASLPKTRY
jgi:hypothetical protein